MLIDKPGFYSSKAGKCEVTEVRGGYALGWRHNSIPGLWFCDTGHHFNDNVFDITGPFVEPRKPVEAWAIQVDGDQFPNLYHTKANAEMCLFNKRNYHKLTARLIHLREVEDS